VSTTNVMVGLRIEEVELAVTNEVYDNELGLNRRL
jgi:hypothetical protein